jgi:hypothetical protein
MLPQFKGIEFKALGISLTVHHGDVELTVGRFGFTAMWGAAALLPGLFIRLGGRERHLEWPFRVARQLTSGREALPGTHPPGRR